MKKVLIFLLCVCSIFVCFGCNKKEDLEKLSQNNTTYSISIDLDVSKKSARVNQSIKYINNTGNILKTLKLNLYPQFYKKGATENVIPSIKLANAYPNGMSYAEFQIERVVVEDKDILFNYSGEFEEILNIDLGFSLMPKDIVEFNIDYNFKLPNCEHRFGYGESTINLANFYPIMCVYKDGVFVENGYSPNGDPFYSDMANYSVDISVPNEYIVASTGVKQTEKMENDKKLVEYNAEMVRDFALVVSNKFNIKTEKWKNVQISYYYYNDYHADTSLKAGVDAIKTFSSLFGEYPYETFNIVQNDFIYGGMEYPNLVMISDEIDYDVDYKNVIIHETAHQWWYGIVGNDEMNEPWLDEALTEFSTVLFYNYNKGYKLTYKSMINSAKENYTLFITVYEDVLGKIDTSMRGCKQYSTEPEYTYCIYVKGVLMFDSLYQLVGKDNFLKSLKQYYCFYKFKNATTEDLIYSFQKICKTDLNNFFNSWLSGKVVIR